jgi:hypothetical protein
MERIGSQSVNATASERGKGAFRSKDRQEQTNQIRTHLRTPSNVYNNQVTYMLLSSQVRGLVKSATPGIRYKKSAENSEQNYNGGSDIRVR